MNGFLTGLAWPATARHEWRLWTRRSSPAGRLPLLVPPVVAGAHVAASGLVRLRTHRRRGRGRRS